MPLGIIALLAVTGFTIAVGEKSRYDGSRSQKRVKGIDDAQQSVKRSTDGSFKDSYDNAYQKLDDGSLIAIPNYKF